MKTNISNEEVIFETLEATGLNWTVKKQPLFTPEGIEAPGVYGAIRNDNNAYIGTVGDRYQFVQNHELVNMAYSAGKEVFSTESDFQHPWNNSETLGSYGNLAGGSLRGGGLVFIQLLLPDAYVGKSDIKRYVTLTNSHDGSNALGFGTTNQVVCCQNTFNIANRELSKFRHTAGIQERIDEAIVNIRKMLLFEEQQMEVFDAASSRSFDKKHVQEMVLSVFGEQILKPDVSTVTKNKVATLADDMNRSIDEQGETMWALFNGVTRYANHSTNTKDKEHSLLFGSDAEINQRAFNTLMRWVNAPLELVEA